MHQIGTVLARFLLSAVFLASATHQVLHWDETEKGLSLLLLDWQTYLAFYEPVQSYLGSLIPWIPPILIGGTLLQMVGGLLLLLGIRERLGAALLVIYLIPTAILAHQFWFLEVGTRESQIVFFLNDMAILGGLFLVLLHGAQARREHDL